jgi:hypothetical protein
MLLLWLWLDHKEAEMNHKMKSAIESYVRSFVIAALVAYNAGITGAEDLLIAGAIATLGPALRAINPKDPAFGLIADTVEVELNKLAKADKKKKKAVKKK